MDLLNFEVIAQYWHGFLRGLGITIFLTVVTMILATALGAKLLHIAIDALVFKRLQAWRKR